MSLRDTITATAKQAYLTGQEPTMGDFTEDLDDAIRSSISYHKEENPDAFEELMQHFETIPVENIEMEGRFPEEDVETLLLSADLGSDGVREVTLLRRIRVDLESDPEVQAKMAQLGEMPTSPAAQSRNWAEQTKRELRF